MKKYCVIMSHDNLKRFEIFIEAPSEDVARMEAMFQAIDLHPGECCYIKEIEEIEK